MATRAERAAERRKHWQHHFEQHEASGLSVRAYAAEQGLSMASWYAARKRYVTASPPPARFARVAMAAGTHSASVTCHIHLPTGAMVEVTTPLETLAQVLAAVSTMR